MEQKKWFLFTDGTVQGPFAKGDVESRVSISGNALIWGRGQTEWLAYDKWVRFQLDQNDPSKRQKSSSERQWKLRVGGQELKSMNYAQMMDFLRTKTDYTDILIWTEGYSEWKEIYQIHKIMDELGVSRRTHPRVPIMGQVLLEGASSTFQGKALSISEGGMGVTEAPNVKIGEKFKINFKSPNLHAPIHATAECVYVGSDGYAGFKFIGLHPESKAVIIEYVKKLSENTRV